MEDHAAAQAMEPPARSSRSKSEIDFPAEATSVLNCAQRGAVRRMQDHRSANPPPSGSEIAYLGRLFRGVSEAGEEVPTRERAIQLLELARWPGGARCPRCESTELVELGGERNAGKGRRSCRECRLQFSPLVETPLANEKAPPEAVVGAALLATRFKGARLAREIEERCGVAAPSSARLALKLQELYESHLAGAASRRGRGRHLAAAAAVLAMTAAGVAAVVLARSGSAPLYAEWVHAGDRIEWVTERRAGEERSLWLRRHSESLARALDAYPPDPVDGK